MPGIIPALAGNTGIRPASWSCGADHPRSRGEYRFVDPDEAAASGSSPLSRGIRLRGVRWGGGLGIIPALAGNTATRRRSSPETRDHPRSRGEYGTVVFTSGSGEGSSPLSRGIQHPDRLGLPGNGIIPALAGNTSDPEEPDWIAEDHPRSRGEYGHETAAADMAAGSSPLSRGIPGNHHRPARVGRIIPALAGNTPLTAMIAGHAPDHPRSRGEYCPLRREAEEATGSSPLSRGIREFAVPAVQAERIIPALAGNTCRWMPTWVSSCCCRPVPP